jgi:hypothetical protein
MASPGRLEVVFTNRIVGRRLSDAPATGTANRPVASSDRETLEPPFYYGERRSAHHAAQHHGDFVERPVRLIPIAAAIVAAQIAQERP